MELTNGMDIWLYILRHAEKIDPDALLGNEGKFVPTRYWIRDNYDWP
jgi:hypothetical protein